MNPLLLTAAFGALCLTGAAAHGQAGKPQSQPSTAPQGDAAEQERYRQAQERYQRGLREAEAARLRYEAELARHQRQVERARRRQDEYDRRMARRNAQAVDRAPAESEARPAVAGPPASPASADRCAQQRERSRRRGRGIGGVVGGIAGGVIGGPAGGVANMVTSVLPVGALIGEAIASLLDCDEQQKAATATEEAVRTGGVVGTTAVWQSETRANVTGSSTVTGAEPLAADGAQCVTVTDIVIVDGEETRAPKRMCRRPPANRFVRV
ncbi:MAG TPA: hypothetical protein VES64_06660 [Allosphingosinicella sp.]|nr:hypothetical protein [Allosphingosinicella sp.]